MSVRISCRFSNFVKLGSRCQNSKSYSSVDFLSYLLLNAARYLVISIHGPAIAFTKCYGRRAYPLKRTSSLLKAVCQKQNHGDIISDETRKNHFYLTESKQGNAKFFSFFISVLSKNRGIYYIYIGI